MKIHIEQESFIEFCPLQVCFNLDSVLIRAISILAETSVNRQSTCSATLAPLKRRSTHCRTLHVLLPQAVAPINTSPSHSLFKRIRQSYRFRPVLLHQLFSIRPIPTPLHYLMFGWKMIFWQTERSRTLGWHALGHHLNQRWPMESSSG